MNNQNYTKENIQPRTSDLDFTLEEEVMAVREAIAFVYAIAAENITGSQDNPLITPEGIALLQVKKEEALRRLLAKRTQQQQP